MLRTEDVQIEIGNQTLVPMFVGRGDGWQANVKLPKDLPAGTYDVSVRVAKLAVSNALSITVNEVRVS